ncbi:unnamed protein product [Zymoseptoria tritici ST99CH_1A5]|uniref:DUF6589 domain-containing protein n=1 Tax=Zymoseptoria tritici ST99CH_1A5 TaxID=1276529 RepID=A0A1Y6LJD4_ZYMTR|nr:unnamed protein product [Zymoseptoria tritici ST99CH_1A5]
MPNTSGRPNTPHPSSELTVYADSDFISPDATPRGRTSSQSSSASPQSSPDSDIDNDIHSPSGTLRSRRTRRVTERKRDEVLQRLRDYRLLVPEFVESWIIKDGRRAARRRSQKIEERIRVASQRFKKLQGKGVIEKELDALMKHVPMLGRFGGPKPSSQAKGSEPTPSGQHTQGAGEGGRGVYVQPYVEDGSEEDENTLPEAGSNTWGVIPTAAGIASGQMEGGQLGQSGPAGGDGDDSEQSDGEDDEMRRYAQPHAFVEVYALIRRLAPTWHELLSGLLRNPRSSRKSAERHERELDRRIFMFSANVLHSRHRNKSNWLARVMGDYLTLNGLNRRALDVLAGQGFVSGHSTINQDLHNHARRQKQELIRLSRILNTFIVYDNMNFMDRVRDSSVSTGDVMRNLTTALMIKSDHIPEGGLTQDMFTPYTGLKLKDVFNSPPLCPCDEYAHRLSMYHMHSAMMAQFGVDIKHLSSDDFVCEQTKWPGISELPPSRCRYHPIGAIFQNEGTIDGTAAVHEDIWINKFKFVVDDPMFRNRLWLVYGDQLTAMRIRSVKQESREANRAFDRREWLIGPSSFFHTAMNLCFTVGKLFWSYQPGSMADLHSVQSDINQFGVTNLPKKKSPY